jgi:ABC-type transporter Mla subunit MlaD
MGTQIAVVSGQQSSANEQIAENVEAIINATNQRQADLQQIARAAEDLNKLTENLRQYMGRVKSSPEQRSHQVSSMHNRTTLSKTLKSSIAVGANGTLIEHEDEPTSEERRTS